MSPILLIARREAKYYLRSWTGYIIIALVLFLDGVFFNVFCAPGDKRSSQVLSEFFFWTSGTIAAASVFVSMRLIAEERQTGTINMLFSSPLRDVEIVLGKFLGGLTFLAVLTGLTVYMPLLIFIHGKISFGHLAAGYIGVLLFSGTVLAIGTFFSSLTRFQIVAAVITAVTTIALICTWMLARVTERPLSDVFTNLALHGLHFQPFQAGIIHLRDVVYYLVFTYVALFAATRSLEARRWR